MLVEVSPERVFITVRTALAPKEKFGPKIIDLCFGYVAGHFG